MLRTGTLVPFSGFRSTFPIFFSFVASAVILDTNPLKAKYLNRKKCINENKEHFVPFLFYEFKTCWLWLRSSERGEGRLVWICRCCRSSCWAARCCHRWGRAPSPTGGPAVAHIRDQGRGKQFHRNVFLSFVSIKSPCSQSQTVMFRIERKV